MDLETPGVIVRSGYGMGRPIFEASECLVTSVLNRYDGGESMEDLVRDFKVPAEHIQAVADQRPAWAEMRDRAKIWKAA